MGAHSKQGALDGPRGPGKDGPGPEKEKFLMIWERKVCWDSESTAHSLPNVVLSFLLTAFTLKENSEYKKHKLVSGTYGLSLRNCNYTLLA